MSEKRKDSRGRVLRTGESQRSDGRYMFRYTDSSGHRATVYSWRLVSTDRTPQNKKQDVPLRELEKKILRDIEDGISRAEKTLNDEFDAFMDMRLDLKASTRYNYFLRYNSWIRDQIGQKPLGSITSTDIQNTYLYLMNERGLKPTSISAVNGIITQVFEDAVDDGKIRMNPCTPAMRKMRRIANFKRQKRYALSVQEQDMFVEHVRINHGRWLYRLVIILLGTGMRIGEAAALSWRDCDFNADLIYIRHSMSKAIRDDGTVGFVVSTPKTESSKRIIPMFRAVKEMLLEEKEAYDYKIRIYGESYDDGAVFHSMRWSRLNIGSMDGVFRRIVFLYNKSERENAAREGRQPVLMPNITPHILRHTFSTRMHENGVDIKVLQETMGHASSDTTFGTYIDATTEEKIRSFIAVDEKMQLM